MRTLLVILAMAGIAAAQEDVKKAEKEAEEKARRRVAEFKVALKDCKTTDDIAGAIGGLADEPHAVILSELKAWLGHPEGVVRSAAGKEIGKFKGDEKAALTLIAAARAEKDPDITTDYIAAFAEIGCKKRARELQGFFTHKETAVSVSAVEACMDLKSKTVISPLISVIESLEAEQEKLKKQGISKEAIMKMFEQAMKNGSSVQGGIAAAGGSISGQQQEMMKKFERIEQVLPKAVAALKEITGEKLNTGKEWRAYEAKNRAYMKDDEEK